MEKLLTTLWVVWTLASVSAQEINAQVTNEMPKTIIIQQDSTNNNVINALNRNDATWVGWKSETLKDEWNEKNRFELHGSARWWSNWTPLLSSKLGDGPSLRLNIDASNPTLGIWASATIFSDFDKNVVMLDWYYQKEIWDFSITWVLEYVNVDKIPESSSITPIVLCNYNIWKWMTIDACYCHTFQKWIDEDDVRIWFTKAFNKSFSLATQLFYKYNWVHKLSERVQAKIKLTDHISIEMFWVRVDGNLNRGWWILLAN